MDVHTGGDRKLSAPLVSVVIPAKDQENYIFDSLQSLTGQGISPSELEVIVVDDGSRDNTSRVAQEFAPVFGQFAIVRNESPSGVSAARNQGIELAGGSTICFLDPDDWYGPGFLRHCLTEMERLDLDFVRTDHTRQTGNHREFWRAPELRRSVPLAPLDGVADPDRSTMLDYPYPCTGLFDTRLVESGLLRFDEECATAEDRELMWRLHTSTTRYAVITEPGFFYRRGVPGSLTAQFSSRQFGYVDAFAKIFQHLGSLNTVAGTPLEFELAAKAARQFLAITAFHIARIDKAQASSRPSSSPNPVESESEDQLERYRIEFSHLVQGFLDVHPGVDFARHTLSEHRQAQITTLLAGSTPAVQEPTAGSLNQFTTPGYWAGPRNAISRLRSAMTGGSRA